MDKMISVLKKIVPELIYLSEKRYTILRSILYLQPVGRRTLAARLNYGERKVRSEIDFLKNQGLIVVDPLGMMITPEGEDVLDGIEQFIHYLKGLSDLEEQLKEILQLERIFVIPGNLDENELVLKEIGRIAAQYIKGIVKDGNIMAVTGGSTIAETANAIVQNHGTVDILVVPARGGMGRDVETQASTVASIFAKKLGGHYRLLHVPDNLGRKAMDTLSKEPDIQSILAQLRHADILVHGIGRASEMAKRRNLKDETIRMLEEKEAVAEAFGYYFNRQGEIVYSTSSVGVDIRDLSAIPVIIGVAGGSQKAEAIMAVTSHHRHSVLITDEGAARRIIELAT